MAVLENRADGDGELVFAVGAPAQSGACLGSGVWLDVGKLRLVVAFAFRADNAVFPNHRFKMRAGFVVRVETIDDLNERKVFERRLNLHAQSLTRSRTSVKCIIPSSVGNLKNRRRRKNFYAPPVILSRSV